MIRKTAIAASLIAGSSLLTGCIGVDPTRDGPYKQRYYDNESYNYYGNRDRDHDGVRNSQDRRPDDPRRY
jgi:hypothetical protein